MALVTAAPAAPAGGTFRRKWVGRSKAPLVIAGEVGTRRGPFTSADESTYYRASGVGDLVDDKTGINTWKINGSMWAAGHDEGLRLSLAAVEDFESDEGKARLRTLREQAEQVSGMVAKREAGTDLHGLLTRIDRGLPLPATLPGKVAPSLAAYRHTISHFRVRAIELTVVCDELGIAGSLDKTVSPLGVMTPVDRDGRQFAPVVTPDDVIVADVKTSGSDEYFGCAFAGQLYPYAASYAYREEEDPAVRAQQQDDGIDLWSPAAALARIGAVHRTPHGARTDVALLIHVPYGGATADLYWFDLVQGREVAQHAMQTRALRARGRRMCARAELPALAAPATVPAPPAHAGQIFGSIKAQSDHARLLEWIGAATTEQALRELWQANWRIWTDAHTTAAGEASARLAGQAVAS